MTSILVGNVNRAIAAARGEAVATVQTITSLVGETRKCIIGSAEVIDSLPVGTAVYAAPPAALAVPADDAIEAAYWDFDARHKGYGPHKTTPQSERDAFKWAVRAMLTAANKENNNG